MSRIFVLLLCYSALGAAAFFVINKKRRDGEARSRWIKLAVYIGITTVFTAALLQAPVVAVGLAILICAGGMAELVRLPRIAGIRKTLLLLCYGCVAGLFCLFIAGRGSAGLSAFVYVIVLSFDGFSQIWGQLIGGPKIAPAVSAGKTWAGLAGGIGMGIATAWFLKEALTLQIVTGAFCICVFSFAGDMLASGVKRLARVKDYSAIIPGHGGILDRFDSFIFTGAALEIYFRLA